MKDITILAGRHRPNALRFGINLFRPGLTRRVVFKPSCRYYLPPPDDDDINKLFGLSQGYHKRNSARVGWRYNADMDRIDLYAYMYVRGKRLFQEGRASDFFIGRVRIDELCALEIQVTKNTYQFYLNNHFRGSFNRSSAPNIGYLLFPYFGGNRAAPNDIHLILR